MAEGLNNESAIIEETIIDEAKLASNKIRLKIEELRLKEKTEFLSFRKQWSTYLLGLVIFLSLFYALFLIAVGREWLSFKDEWLVRIIITGGFAQIIALAKIVIDFLFKEPPVK